MGAVKNYFNDVICACSDTGFGQQAVEYALVSGLVDLTGDFDADVRVIMDHYDAICDAYRGQMAFNEALLVESYQPLLAQITRTL